MRSCSVGGIQTWEQSNMPRSGVEPVSSKHKHHYSYHRTGRRSRKGIDLYSKEPCSNLGRDICHPDRKFERLSSFSPCRQIPATLTRLHHDRVCPNPPQSAITRHFIVSDTGITVKQSTPPKSTFVWTGTNMKSGQCSIAKVAVRWTRTSRRHSSDICEWHPRHQLNVFLDGSSPDTDPI